MSNEPRTCKKCGRTVSGLCLCAATRFGATADGFEIVVPVSGDADHKIRHVSITGPRCLTVRDIGEIMQQLVEFKGFMMATGDEPQWLGTLWQCDIKDGLGPLTRKPISPKLLAQLREKYGEPTLMGSQYADEEELAAMKAWDDPKACQERIDECRRIWGDSIIRYPDGRTMTISEAIDAQSSDEPIVR